MIILEKALTHISKVNIARIDVSNIAKVTYKKKGVLCSTYRKIYNEKGFDYVFFNMKKIYLEA